MGSQTLAGNHFIKTSFMSLSRLWGSLCVSLIFCMFCLIFLDIVFPLFSCAIFLFVLSKPRLFNIVSIFLVSVFMDIYNGQLIGLSFCQFFFLYFCVLRFRILILNSRIIFGIYFFFLLVSASEGVGFVITKIILGHHFDIDWHIERVCMSVFFCALYCSLAFAKRKLQNDRHIA